MSVGAFGAGRIGGPGRNYFMGDITGFQFEAFTVGGQTIRTAEAGLFDFGPGAGEGFTFNESPKNLPRLPKGGVPGNERLDKR